MYTTRQNNTTIGNIKLFGNIRVLIVAALLTALSGAVGKVISIDVMPFARIGLENLPVIMAGIWFGPFIGGAVGFGADYFGCFLKGNPPSPLVTLGFVSLGIVSGFLSMYLFKKNKALNIIVAELGAHIVGSMIIKSIGLYHLFGGQYPITVVFAWRIPLYIAISAFETAIILMLMKNKAFSSQLDRICNNAMLR